MWQHANLDPAMIADAREALEYLNAGGRVHGFIVNVDWALSWFPGGRNSGVWTWPRDSTVNKPWHPGASD
jgi:hypothetical protein